MAVDVVPVHKGDRVPQVVGGYQHDPDDRSLIFSCSSIRCEGIGNNCSQA